MVGRKHAAAEAEQVLECSHVLRLMSSGGSSYVFLQLFNGNMREQHVKLPASVTSFSSWTIFVAEKLSQWSPKSQLSAEFMDTISRVHRIVHCHTAGVKWASSSAPDGDATTLWIQLRFPS